MKEMIKKYHIKGTVQGVGFRPFVYRIAHELELRGWVKNTGSGVEVEIRGDEAKVHHFRENLLSRLPSAANIAEILEMEPDNEAANNFRIIKSEGKVDPDLNISPDIAICGNCRRELDDPSDRRHDYPFINCTNCGPRYTLINRLPYDRHNVSMGEFQMCDRCEKEYSEILDRRYHAQPICCEECGPQYTYKELSGEAAVLAAAEDLKNGSIIAVKGWGGFHMMGNALDPEVIAKARKLKKREHKPIAVIAKTLETVKEYCIVSGEDELLLTSFRRPIVLLPKKTHNDITEGLSPQNNSLGVMLPYSPIQLLLFKYSGLELMIATSINAPSAPTLTDGIRVSEFFDGNILDNNLEITFQNDDSVLKSSSGPVIMLRRSRGYVPAPIAFPFDKSVLSSGARENIAFCYTQGGKAYTSQYFGTIDEVSTQERYLDSIEKWKDIWNYDTKLLICDRHPQYGSTEIFTELARKWDKPLIQVQHHHAHLAGCAAENGLSGDLLGACFDGTGYGDDETVWGGEFLVFNYKDFSRKGRLKPHSMPGGDMAAKEPWRMAISYLKEAGIDYRKFDHLKNIQQAAYVESIIAKNLNTPLSSSAGRLFDAVAALLNVAMINTFSARAPIALEALVDTSKLKEGYNISYINGDMFSADTSDIIRGIVEDMDKGCTPVEISSKFHFTMATIVVAGLDHMRRNTGIDKACLSGGVFCNGYLPALSSELAKDKGIQIYTQKQISPNDNGISFGQAAIGAAFEGE
ncbi:carbamoyltransferase HypF [bacterium]|nr:carbamoyltransferase HypF [bacterium]